MKLHMQEICTCEFVLFVLTAHVQQKQQPVCYESS